MQAGRALGLARMFGGAYGKESVAVHTQGGEALKSEQMTALTL